MYQAIMTKYLGPTNVRGSRVKATCAAGTITVNWDDAWNSYRNHCKAAQQLAERFGWRGVWHGGTLPDGTTAFVCVINNEQPEFEVRS